ncbi:uncharacterized protein [Cicer arietinum]|uniref:Uncharacterized protein LOC113784499 n=1 Tax=Cicer arietinum TaxID=3827 RepID=A0A3Q7XRS7_CICAR|nr:uncharacterized protein LOC113784499 [Cicer arietinum]
MVAAIKCSHLFLNNMEPNPRPPGRPRRGQNNDERWEQMMQQQQLMMQQQQVVTTSIMNYLAQSVEPAHPPPPPPPEASNILFYDFHKLKPPAFLRSPVPLEAQSWLDEMTKFFLVVRCTEEDKVAFATHMLQGEAEN